MRRPLRIKQARQPRPLRRTPQPTPTLRPPTPPQPRIGPLLKPPPQLIELPTTPLPLQEPRNAKPKRQRTPQLGLTKANGELRSPPQLAT